MKIWNASFVRIKKKNYASFFVNKNSRPLKDMIFGEDSIVLDSDKFKLRFRLNVSQEYTEQVGDRS